MIGKRHFDVQMMGGAALHFGWIAEMKTGEGKTLVATAPPTSTASPARAATCHRQRLPGRFPRRVDGAGLPLVGPVRRHRSALAATAPTRPVRGRHHLRHQQRVRLRLPARQHGADSRGQVQRGHRYAIVDEVDSILIDEARVPLIISGPANQAAKLYYQFAGIVRAPARRRLRGRRREAHRRSHRGGHLQGRRSPRRGEPLRRRSATSCTSSATPCGPKSCTAATRSTS